MQRTPHCHGVSTISRFRQAYYAVNMVKTEKSATKNSHFFKIYLIQSQENSQKIRAEISRGLLNSSTVESHERGLSV